MEFSNKLYYTNETGSFSLINGDTFKELKKFSNKRFDMIFADPPYFLSNDGITCSGGKMVSVNKGDWDRTLTQEDKHKFNKKWIRECYRIVQLFNQKICQFVGTKKRNNLLFSIISFSLLLLYLKNDKATFIIIFKNK